MIEAMKQRLCVIGLMAAVGSMPGCARPVLPTVRLTGRAGLDVAKQRHASWSVHISTDFALERGTAPPPGAKQSSAEAPLSPPCGADILCRYVRRAADQALAALLEVP